ncbi:hypothetical protein D8B26_008076 [Coccidioides posadasii str. Silveira]|uniref:uncharacterized protein n=1 Tax=Coccidioides posadasii (strain RMSCC 757 / Silveira) TaxID=443226 RepID=UPI001BF17D17|nr:hypothetical protein D8B26_008076 [Coccidioides posadasii str. Silveira]
MDEINRRDKTVKDVGLSGLTPRRETNVVGTILYAIMKRGDKDPSQWSPSFPPWRSDVASLILTYESGEPARRSVVSGCPSLLERAVTFPIYRNTSEWISRPS